MKPICKKIKVEGRVQGVFFRAFTQKTALKLQLSGWVRNENDGGVLLMACGEEEQIEALIAALRKGPPASQVDNLHIEDADPQAFIDFVIQR